ncbi:hypothetical protein [uncultured Jatrophihabitans sp.]|uniref:hypothetical protein n=1 Tax=uncultured Jatrophihabitans sp. TaxID=1610747 RepID=UPI0035CA1B0F
MSAPLLKPWLDTLRLAGVAAEKLMHTMRDAFTRLGQALRAMPPAPPRHVDVDDLFPGHLVNSAANDPGLGERNPS